MALTCSDKGCQHPVLGSEKGALCGRNNSFWLHQYSEELGLKKIIDLDWPWSFMICMEPQTGYNKHCCLGAVEHLKTHLDWLADLMLDSGSGNTDWDKLELSNPEFVFNLLSNLHGRMGQGFSKSGWMKAKVETDKCQCTLVLATCQIDLSAIVHSPVHLQPMVQDIPKETPKGSTWGLQE